MVNGRVKFHIAPTGCRKHPSNGPQFDNVASLQVQMISRAKQSAIDNVFKERAQVEYASEYCILYWSPCTKPAQELCASNKCALRLGREKDSMEDIQNEAKWIDDDWDNNPLDAEMQITGEGHEIEHFEEYIGS